MSFISCMLMEVNSELIHLTGIVEFIYKFVVQGDIYIQVDREIDR